MNRNIYSSAVAFAGDVHSSGSVDYGVLMPVEVHFDDLDAFGMLHNSRYQVMVERGWAAYWLGQGLGGESGRDGDAFGVVKQFEVVFDMPVTRPGAYGVHFWVERVGRTSAVAGYRLCSLDGSVTYAHGTRTIVRLDPASLRPAPWSDEVRDLVQVVMKPQDTAGNGI
jgi:acyl-CoA thioester hydrolase